jgi:hypothetical protein
MIKNNDIVLVINTVEERRNAIADSRQIRTSALLARVTTFTTIAGAEAAVEGMRYMDHSGCDFSSGDARSSCAAPDSGLRTWLVLRQRSCVESRHNRDHRRTATFGGFILCH